MGLIALLVAPLGCGSSDRAGQRTPSSSGAGLGGAHDESGGLDGAGGDLGRGGDASAGSGGALGGTPDVGGSSEAGADPGDSAGASGVGGMSDGGSAGCNTNSPFSCDDGDSCTRDSLSRGCECVHEALEEGSPCNDGNTCTKNDTCSAGVCRGEQTVSTAEVLGSLRSFGTTPGLLTQVAFVAPDRAVFVSGKTTTLVALNGDELEVLDRIEMAMAVRVDNVSSLIWVSRPRTFVFPLTQKRFAVAGQYDTIDIYDIVANQLVLASRYPFPGFGENDIHAATGNGSRLWTCWGNSVEQYAVEEASGKVTPDRSFLLPTSHSCQGLALTPDKETLLVPTSNGLDRLDISDPGGAMALMDSGPEGQFLLDAAASDTRVAAYQLVNQYAGYGDVRAWDSASLEEVEHFPMNVSGATPVGLAMAGSRLLVQEDDSTGCTNQARLFDMTHAPFELVSSSAVTRACSPVAGSLPHHLVATKDYVVLEPMHQIVRIDQSTGQLTALRGLLQGSFERVLAVGPNTVEVHSPFSMHLVDISNPAVPVVKDGGVPMPVDLEQTRLELHADASAPAFLTAPSTPLQRNAGPVTTLCWSNGADLPTVAGSIQNDDEEQLDDWIASGPYLYQLDPKDAQDLRLRRYAAASLTQSERQVLTPVWDQVLIPAPLANPPSRTGSANVSTLRFAIEPRTGDLIVAERRGSSGVLLGFSLDHDGYHPSFSRLVAATPVGVATVGARSVVLFNNRVLTLNSAGETMAEVQFSAIQAPGSTLSARALLGFDGELAYLSMSISNGNPNKLVLVLRADNLSEVTRYYAPETVLSMTEAGGHLVFGMGSTLMVASPECAAAP